MAGQRLRVSWDGVANGARDRSDGHDQKGESEKGSEGRRGGAGQVHWKAVWRFRLRDSNSTAILVSRFFRNGIEGGDYIRLPGITDR